MRLIYTHFDQIFVRQCPLFMPKWCYCNIRSLNWPCLLLLSTEAIQGHSTSVKYSSPHVIIIDMHGLRISHIEVPWILLYNFQSQSIQKWRAIWRYLWWTYFMFYHHTHTYFTLMVYYHRFLCKCVCVCVYIFGSITGLLFGCYSHIHRHHAETCTCIHVYQDMHIVHGTHKQCLYVGLVPLLSCRI